MDDYKQRVFKMLDELEPSKIIVVHAIAHPKTEVKFIGCVKDYIDTVDNRIEFNSDFSKFRRLDYDRCS